MSLARLFFSTLVSLATLSRAGHAACPARDVPCTSHVDQVDLPPALREDGPAPLPRAPSYDRQPLEIGTEFALTLPVCDAGAGGERCRTLGPALGGALVAVYRPSPYFAFGGAAAYVRARGRAAGGASLGDDTLGLHALGRVYLLDEGRLDPYLELMFGWSASQRTSVRARGRVDTAAFGPSARAGGGVNLVVGGGLKFGVAAGFVEQVLAEGERCAGAACGSLSGAAVAGLRLTLALGEAL